MRKKDNEDALKRPVFGFKSKIGRFVWHVIWFTFFRFTPVPCHGWRCMILRCFGAKIGVSNFIYPSSRIWAPWLLETEDVVTIGPRVEVYNPGGIKLGHHTIISQDAYLCGATHDYNSSGFEYVPKPIMTGSYVWICARAIVLPGVTAADGSVLGAGSVISRNLEAWTVYAGNPATAVKKRQWEAGADPTRVKS